MSIIEYIQNKWNEWKQTWPSQCPLCRLPALGGLLCKACWSDCLASRQNGYFCRVCAIRVSLQEGVCLACQSRPPPFSRTIAAVDYDFPIPLLMYQYKTLCQIHLSGVCANIMWQTLQTEFPEWPIIQAWVAVPSSAKALKRRGFNPAMELARQLSFYSRLPLVRTALRVNESLVLAEQKQASRDHRWQQALDRYEAGVPLKGQWVGLVDDVMTTGSTLHACSQALMSQGAKGVIAVVLARTPRTLAQF